MRVRNARLDMTEKPAERIAILELTVEMGKEAEEVADARFKAGRLGKADVESARLFRLEAELALLREKHKLDPPKRR
jgi:outer membrane protein TolC